MIINWSAVIPLLVGAAFLQVTPGFQRQPEPPMKRLGPVAGTPPILIYVPEPRTLQLAKLARIQGEVRMIAEIDEQGAIASLVVQQGHPLLIAAAMEAAQRNRYKPGNINGLPARFIIPVTIDFKTEIVPVEVVPIN